MAATAVKIPVDGGGDQWREVAGDEEMILRPESAEQDTRGRKISEEFPKFDPWVYIS